MPERFSPNDMAREAQRILDEMLPLREAEADKRKRKDLSRRIKTARMMRDWARTRAGYVKGA